VIRFYRKSDADLLATVMEERDRLENELSMAQVERSVNKGLAEQYIKEISGLQARIRELEETQKKFYQSQNETVKTLLASTVESNTPVVWPEREQVKINAVPPRSLVGTLKAKVIQQAAKRQAEKKPDVVQ
jgi:tyrosyl-tRNA synthetase